MSGSREVYLKSGIKYRVTFLGKEGIILIGK